MTHADAFRWITVALSMVLGLGVARLLTALVAQFHARRHRQTDWLPLAWAGIVFFHQIAFWWGIEELSTMPVPNWTAASFVMLLSLALTLFLAAALVLPHTDTEAIPSLRQFFAQDGRWCLPVLASYNLLAVAANLLLWKIPLLSIEFAVNAALAAFALACFLLPRRRQPIATLAYGALLVAGATSMLPASY